MNVNDLLGKSVVGQVAQKSQADIASQVTSNTGATQSVLANKPIASDMPATAPTSPTIQETPVTTIPSPIPVNASDITLESKGKVSQSENNVSNLKKSVDDAKKEEKEVPKPVENDSGTTEKTISPEPVSKSVSIEKEKAPKVNAFGIGEDLPKLTDSFDYPKNEQTDNAQTAGVGLVLEKKRTDEESNVPKEVSSGELTVQPQAKNVPGTRSEEVEKKDLEVIKSSNRFSFTMDQLFEIVVQKNASDLHVTADYPVQIRVDGDLFSLNNEILDASGARELIYSVLTEELKEVVEVNKEVDFAYAYKDIARFRVNAFHAMGNLSGAFRLIPNKIRTLEELKLPKLYHELANLRQGLVLVTGPTGHGKSTTLAAILNEINLNQSKHIITIEDPVEYVYPRGKALVDQREIKQDTHGWDIALKSVLREDPDVVLVGEMRDYETISAAITVAETGHLVLATLHTNSAAQTIDRIIDVFPEHQQGQIRTQLATVTEAVVAQRLVKLIGGGRRAVSEVMLGTPAVRNIIREGKTYQLDNVIRTSSDVGMISIERSLVELVREGVLSVEDAQSYAMNPDEVIRLLK